MWWESLSLFLYFSLFHCWFTFRGSQFLNYLPAFGVFLVTNFLRFQPGAMDNTKVFCVAWFPLACCAVAHFLMRIADRGRYLAVALLLPSIVSGVLCVLKSLSLPYPIFSPRELEVGLWAIENTPLEAVFDTMVYPGISVTSISGRTALMTFPGWAWAHGICNATRQGIIDRMWESADPAIFRWIGANYTLRIKNRQPEKWERDTGDRRWLWVLAHKA
jgi:hypothetical protein